MDRRSFLEDLMARKGMKYTKLPLLPFVGIQSYPGKFRKCKLDACMANNNGCDSCNDLQECTNLYDALC